METLTLQTETRRLLDLVVHSLYTRRDIFLRELITNASDALDRFRLERLVRPELVDSEPLEIRLEVDPAARTLTVRDNGIGMSRDEVIGHIGTIARSGTQEAARHLKERHGVDEALNLIGRFGVGFYSSFMVADEVTLVTCRAGEKHGTRWDSSGDIEYSLDDAPESPRGTAVTLHLKPVDAENGIEDFTDRSVLSGIVKRYADFVTHPIVLVGAAEATGSSAGESSTLNSMKPIWTRPAADVKPDEYNEFYRHLSNDWTEPLQRMAFKAEGRWEYSALLFVPAHAPYDLYYHAAPYGLQLYARRMLVVENCQGLVPRYLRFLKGVVDAADLPLNVSRQTLQDAQHLTAIRRWLTRKVLDGLQKLYATDAARYETLWREFGRALKEGVSEDAENKDRLVPLLQFESSYAGGRFTTLADYVARMKPDQKDIFYVAGESRALIERSPHVEALRARDYEVLYLSDAVDELLARALPEFDGRRLRSAGKGEIDLGDGAEREREAQEQTDRLAELLAGVAKLLDGKVRDVRVSRRLTTSVSCLTSDESAYSPHIERLLNGKGAPRQRRTLELNPTHPIVSSLHERFRHDRTDPLIAAAAEVLFGAALLAEGSDLPEPGAFNEQLAQLLLAALDRSVAEPA